MATKDIRVLFNKLDEINYQELDVTEILGNREYPNFHDNWVRVFMRLMHIKYDVKYPAGRNQIAETYKKRTFQKVMKLSNDMGLAMEISSDMELMYDGLVLKYDDPWFLWMVECYERGEIPMGTLD